MVKIVCTKINLALNLVFDTLFEVPSYMLGPRCGLVVVACVCSGEGLYA